MMQFPLFLFGLLLLLKAADWFLDAGIKLSRLVRIPTVVIGATLVSLATTLPETTISFIAGLRGHTDLALGNALATPVMNLALIFPLFFLAAPMTDPKKVVSIRAGVFLATLVGIWMMAAISGEISSAAGFALLLLAGIYIVLMYMVGRPLDRKSTTLMPFFEWLQMHLLGHIRWARNESVRIRPKILAMLFGKFLFGLFAIVVSGQVLVDQGMQIANTLHVPDYLIGMTLIAFGTSLPEFATALSAIKSRRESLSVSNLLGASFLTITLALGLAAFLSPVQVDASMLTFDFPLAFLAGASTILLVHLRPRRVKPVARAIVILFLFALVARSLWIAMGVK
ncbi:MAG: sodium:calcium antiporter [bacterium]|nr:sodium:calcium antiporter [bacterium]